MSWIRRARRDRIAATSLLTGAIMVGVLFLSSCYVYVPVASPPPPGEPVRLLLGADAQQRLSAQAARTITTLEGRLTGADADSIRVSTRLTTGPERGTGSQLRQVFTVSRSEIVQIQAEELSRTRTALLGGALLTAVVTVIYLLSATEGGDPGDRPPTFPDAPSISPGTATPSFHR